MAEELAISKSQSDSMKIEPQAGKLSRLAAFTPTTLTEAIALAKLIAASDLAPKDFKGKPANVLIAMQMGAEVGLAPMAAIQNVAVINGRPSIWGDAALAIIQVHPEYDWHKEWVTGEGEGMVAHCTIKRKGQEPHESKFSVPMAKIAGLWGKVGPWKTNPDRMLQMRARGFALRDKFADALRGLRLAEEAMDIPADTSDARKKRDEGSLEIGATISDLSPSSEPNRGHGDEGMQRASTPAAEKKEVVMCAECRETDGHTAECSQAKSAQDHATSKPTKKGVFLILGITEKTKKDTKAPYLLLEVTDEKNQHGKLYVWHKSFFEYILPNKDQLLLCEVSAGKQGNSTFHSVEHLLECNGVTFVNDKPAVTGEMPAESEGVDLEFDE